MGKSTSIDWIERALSDYARSVAPSLAEPFAVFADQHIARIRSDLQELERLRSQQQASEE